MSQPRFGVTFDLHLYVRATDAGGRSRPIVDGYRPLCIVGSLDGETVVGLCELHLDNPISPGESGVGRLSFDVAVSDTVRALLRVGSTFDLAEGQTVVAAAEVQGIGP
jgi:translation elongation factor EF-Tu-like GTPase